MPTISEVSLGAVLGEAVKNSATPSKLVGAAALKAKNAKLVANTAAAKKAAADKAKAQADNLAAKARAEAKTNPAKAGELVVKTLAAKREAVIATQQASKAQVASKLQAEAAKHTAQAQTFQSAAVKARAAGQTVKASDLALQADRQRNAADQKRIGAQSVMSRPVNVPPDLSAEKIAEVGAKFNVRVSRKLSSRSGDADHVSTWLRGIDGTTSEFGNVAGAVADYGSGPVGMLMAGAELGNLKLFDSGLAGLNSLGVYASEPKPDSGVYPVANCVPKDGIPTFGDAAAALKKYCDCAYPVAAGGSVAIWNKRCNGISTLAARGLAPWTQAGRFAYGLPSPDLEAAMKDGKKLVQNPPKLPELPKLPTSTKPAQTPAQQAAANSPNTNPQSQIVVRDEKPNLGPKTEIVVNSTYPLPKPQPKASNTGLLIGAGVVVAAGAFFALRK